MRGRNTMECPWFRIVWLLFVSTSARFIKDVENESPHDLGTCFYNGSWYKESEELPTRGLCLICHCFEGFTEPNAFTCSVIDCPWDDYHKRFPGCTPIYADRDCCPIGWECDYGSRFPEQHLSKDSTCDCEWRYLKHYEAKGCRPVYEEKPQGEKPSCACPWRFDCSLADEIHADDRVCSYKKQIYTVGSKINTTNPCETCSCVTDYFTQAASISCVSVECPSVFSTNPLPEGCHYVYKKGECCPVGVECPSRQDETIYNVPLCEYNGKMYYEGEQIYPEEDPCLICLCTDDWTGINSTSCRQHDCMLERDARKLRQGCIPIYHEKTCCPIDYHCADEELDFNSNLEPSFKSDDDEEEMCFFEGRYYAIGHVLDIKHPTNCVTCTCKTPPDFTCIHSSCPPPPNNDYVNCKAVYKPHSCCPDYTCTGKSNTVCPDPICNGTNCWLVKQDDGCSVCRCKSRCVPCPYMCQPENPENECSGCICQLNSTSIKKENEDIQSENDLKANEGSLQDLAEECKKIKCSPDERCMLTEMRCFKQNCLPLPKCEKYSLGCGRRSCPSGCDEIGSYEDSCPICYCRKQFQEPQFKLTCKKHTCEENCVLSGRDENGCPLCQCSHISSNDKMCPVSRCVGYNCTLALNVEGCPECICQLPCKPRECPSGCEVDLSDSSDNGLTCACQCKNSSTAIDYIYSKPIRESCSPITCRGYNCSMSEDDSGCPMCSCKESCKPPTCLSGCIVEKDPPAGRCPGCVCKLSRSARDNTEKECPPPTCLGYNCSVLEGADGCQRCICESPCEESPVCPSHCQLETDVPHGRCRGCICSYSESLDLQSKGLENKTVSIHRGGGKVPESVLGGEYEVNAEEREDIEADFIPLPNKDLVPSIDKLYLIHDKNKPTLTAHSGQLFPHLASFYHEHIAGSYYTDDPVVNEQGTSLNAYERGGSQGKKNVHSQHSSETSTITSETQDGNVKGGFENGDVLEEKNFEYEDLEEKAFEDEEKCIQKNCPSGQTCVLRRLQCIRMPCPVIPVCIDIEPVCPIPVCAIGCMVMKWDDEVCPSCFCGIIRGAQGRVCPRIPCLGRGCYNVIGDDGCPICKCDSICIPPKCSEGCKLETDPPEGRCPTCSCPPKVAPTTAAPISSTHIAASAVKRPSSQHYPLKKPEEYHCPTPHCNGYNCSLLRGPDDCQRCVCDSPCAPCPSHCVKTKTSSVGRCPVCDCTVAEKKCPTVNCYGTNCRKVKDSNGCLTCVCDPECVTPKCDPGCDILTDVPPGQCPGCVCKVTVVQAVVQKQRQCRPVACIGINCQEVRGSDGCPKCFCEPLCPPPKCDPGCEVQTDVAAGQCPTCVCADFPDDDDDEDESYCPNLFCADYGCLEIPGPAGCPICLCDPICKTPVCEPGCHIVTNRYHGRCPVCLCSSPLDDMTPVSNSSIIANQLATTVGVVLEPVVAETELPSTDEPTTTATPTELLMTTTTELPTTTTTELPTTTTTLAPTTTTELTTTACPPPVCEGLRCRKVLSEDGCMTCKCRFKCPKPKCVGNCYAEVNPPPHRCPGCICPVRRRPEMDKI